jgi:hypothetical protein
MSNSWYHSAIILDKEAKERLYPSLPQTPVCRPSKRHANHSNSEDMTVRNTASFPIRTKKETKSKGIHPSNVMFLAKMETCVIKKRKEKEAKRKREEEKVIQGYFVNVLSAAQGASHLGRHPS